MIKKLRWLRFGTFLSYAIPLVGTAFYIFFRKGIDQISNSLNTIYTSHPTLFTIGIVFTIMIVPIIIVVAKTGAFKLTSVKLFLAVGVSTVVYTLMLPVIMLAAGMFIDETMFKPARKRTKEALKDEN